MDADPNETTRETLERSLSILPGAKFKKVKNSMDAIEHVNTATNLVQDSQKVKNVTDLEQSELEQLEEHIKKLGKGTVNATPNYGQKLEYVFGNATGNKHNIDRSIAMERQLNSIGIFDNSKGRELVLDNLTATFNDVSSILKTQENGRVVRESLLTGPQGVLKVESVWDGEKLITVKFFGGK